MNNDLIIDSLYNKSLNSSLNTVSDLKKILS